MCVLFSGCSNVENGEVEVVLTAQELIQSTWNGCITRYDKDETVGHKEFFIVQFLTESEGKYINGEGSGYPSEVDKLFYQINNRIITFRHSIVGEWTIMEKTKNQIILQAYLPQKHVMILDRKY